MTRIKPPEPPKPPAPPMHPGPPLPVDIARFCIQADVPAKRSQYEQEMGKDYTLLIMAVDAPWSPPELQDEARRIVGSGTLFNKLSREDLDKLDEVLDAYRRNDGKPPVQQAPDPRLRVSEDERDDEDVSSRDGSDLRSGHEEPTGQSPHYPTAYDWLK